MKRKKYAYLILVTLLFASCAHTNQEDNDASVNEQAEDEIIPININGTWVSKDNPLYPILEFKGKSTVVIKTFLAPFASGYERDEEFIRVRTDQSDLLFEIISEDSIIGSGFAKGHWIRKK